MNKNIKWYFYRKRQVESIKHKLHIFRLPIIVLLLHLNIVIVYLPAWDQAKTGYRGTWFHWELSMRTQNFGDSTGLIVVTWSKFIQSGEKKASFCGWVKWIKNVRVPMWMEFRGEESFKDIVKVDGARSCKVLHEWSHGYIHSVC